VQFGVQVTIYDPWADINDVKEEYGITITNKLDDKDYEALIIAVAHKEFLEIDYNAYKSNGTVIFDTKSFIDRALTDGRL
jgi:UDP-N-acetyl-D-galactosamine dehydrogenase